MARFDLEIGVGSRRWRRQLPHLHAPAGRGTTALIFGRVLRDVRR
jgi:hypothetical protein